MSYYLGKGTIVKNMKNIAIDFRHGEKKDHKKSKREPIKWGQAVHQIFQDFKKPKKCHP